MNETQFPTTEHYTKEFFKDKNSIFIDIESEEQEEGYSCGPAVVADILKTSGKKVTQEDLIQEAVEEIAKMKQNIERPRKKRLSIEDIGTPPEVLQYLLSSHGVEFEIKESVDEITQETTEQAKQYLDDKLKEGSVVICPVQTIPNYGEERDIEADGHYLIVCGKTLVNGKENYIVIDPMFHYYQRLSNEGSIYRTHMGDAKPENAPQTKTEREILYDTTETRFVPYTQEQQDIYDINPKKYGVRFVSAERFMQNWKDVSGFEEEYNQYGIAVKIPHLR